MFSDCVYAHAKLDHAFGSGTVSRCKAKILDNKFECAQAALKPLLVTAMKSPPRRSCYKVTTWDVSNLLKVRRSTVKFVFAVLRASEEPGCVGNLRIDLQEGRSSRLMLQGPAVVGLITASSLTDGLRQRCRLNCWTPWQNGKMVE
jgi:hypothetical protein